jgi:hypothetical protein
MTVLTCGLVASATTFGLLVGLGCFVGWKGRWVVFSVVIAPGRARAETSLVASHDLRDHDLQTQPVRAVRARALWLVALWLDYPRTRHQKSPLLSAPVLEGPRTGGDPRSAVGTRRWHWCRYERSVLGGPPWGSKGVGGGETAASALRVIRMPCRLSEPLRCALVRRVLSSSDLTLRGADQHVATARVTARLDGDGRGGGEECGLQKLAARWSETRSLRRPR